MLYMINVVLYQPEKPLNTGNIMRTCVASGVSLHIIGPLTYKIDDKGLKRAGMDYLIGLDYSYYENYEEFLKLNNDPIVHYITRYGFKALVKWTFLILMKIFLLCLEKRVQGYLNIF